MMAASAVRSHRVCTTPTESMTMTASAEPACMRKAHGHHQQDGRARIATSDDGFHRTKVQRARPGSNQVLAR